MWTTATLTSKLPITSCFPAVCRVPPSTILAAQVRCRVWLIAFGLAWCGVVE
jgi:hypothetical protein